MDCSKWLPPYVFSIVYDIKDPFGKTIFELSKDIFVPHPQICDLGNERLYRSFLDRQQRIKLEYFELFQEIERIITRNFYNENIQCEVFSGKHASYVECFDVVTKDQITELVSKHKMIIRLKGEIRGVKHFNLVIKNIYFQGSNW